MTSSTRSLIPLSRLPTKYEDLAPFYAEKLALAAQKDNEAIKNGETGGWHKKTRRLLCRSDLFYLLTVELHCKFMLVHPKRQWLLDRVREVQREPNGYLDLWAREHFKSTIITYGLTIQDVLKDPEVTIGIFSWKKPVAIKFLRQIKLTLQENENLKYLFPDILWANAERDAPKWSEQDGIIVRRKSTPKESTIEAHGLIDGQPIGAHFGIRVYDDLVTDKSITTDEMLEKVLVAYQLSDNLGTEDGVQRVIGTRYSFADAYGWMIDQGMPTRIYPCTKDGTEDGEPVLMSQETLRRKRKAQGPSVFATQMLLNPKGGARNGFERQWLEYYTEAPKPEKMNCYLIVDPANKKKKRSDYTSMMVVGASPSEHYYILFMLRDKLSLSERTKWVFDLYFKYKIKRCGYEEYGMQSDIDHIKEVMDIEGMRINIVPLGGKLAKQDRIMALQPTFEQGKIVLPQKQMYTNFERDTRDLVRDFVEIEYMPFPLAAYDDSLDCLARIHDPDLGVKFPRLGADQSRSRFKEAVTRYDHFRR